MPARLLHMDVRSCAAIEACRARHSFPIIIGDFGAR